MSEGVEPINEYVVTSVIDLFKRHHGGKGGAACADGSQTTDKFWVPTSTATRNWAKSVLPA